MSSFSNDIAVKPTVAGVDVIEEALRRNAALDSRPIKVRASGSTVTLSGSVRSWREKQEGQNAA